MQLANCTMHGVAQPMKLKQVLMYVPTVAAVQTNMAPAANVTATVSADATCLGESALACVHPILDVCYSW